MTPNRHWFKTYQPLVIPVRVADGNIVMSCGVGNVVFQPVVHGVEKRKLEFERVLHVPDLRSNLFSVLYLTECKGYTVKIAKGRMNFS